MRGRISEPATRPCPLRDCAGSLYEPQPISDRPAALGLAVRGGVDVSIRENIVFVHGVLDLQRYGGISEPGMGTCPPRVAFALRALANQQSVRGIGVSTPAVSTRENSIFVHGVSEL